MRRRWRRPPPDAARRLDTLLEVLPAVAYRCRLNSTRTMLEMTGAVESLTGLPAARFLEGTASLDELVHPGDRERVREVLRGAAAEKLYEVEYRLIQPGGALRWVRERGRPVADAPDARTLEGFLLDVTERQRQHARLARLDRTRAVMSEINTLITRARSRMELFQEACRIAFEKGGFPLAWIGLVQDARDVLPVASHGDDGGLLHGLRVPLKGGGPEGCGPTRTALLEKRVAVCNDAENDPAVSAWRARLGALGLRSFVSIPLLPGGQVRGCMNLYAREPGFFDDDEMTLLAELSGDITYALEFLLKDETLGNLSVYDPLTRLPNRELFRRRLEGFVAAGRERTRAVAVVMADIEHFKAINDAIGHEAADDLLRRVAERFKYHAGGAEFVARVSGDRFAAVLPDLEPGVDVEALIREGGWDRLDPPHRHGDEEIPISFHVGFAAFPQDAADGAGLLRNAELALKQGKEDHRRLTRYAAHMSEIQARRLKLEGQLRQALARGEFVLHYQPKIDLRNGAICGAEALLRWSQPARGLVGPGEFIPALENSGLIVPVGEWALREALQDFCRWDLEGLRPPRVAVNVSQVQVAEPDFVGAVDAVLQTRTCDPVALELEITESLLMREPAARIEKLRRLSDLGFTLSIDDFGTGYSSLAYLGRLPLHALKIDRSFVSRMAEAPANTAVVSTIVSLARAMNLRVIAEGVDSPEQLELLRMLKCDEVQGFLFSEGVPPERFAALLRSGRRFPLDFH